MASLPASAVKLKGHKNGLGGTVCVSTDTFKSLGYENGIGQDYDPSDGSAYPIEYWAFKYNVPVTFCLALYIDPLTGLRNMSFSDVGEMFEVQGVDVMPYFRTDGLTGEFTAAASQPMEAAVETMIQQQGTLNALTKRNYPTAAWRGSGYPPRIDVASALMRYVITMRVASDPGYVISGGVATQINSFYGTGYGAVHPSLREGYDKNHSDQMFDQCTLASRLENASDINDGDVTFDAILADLYPITETVLDEEGLCNIFEHLYKFAPSRPVDGREYARQALEGIGAALDAAETSIGKTFARVSYHEAMQILFLKSLVDSQEVFINENAVPAKVNAVLTIALTDKYPAFENTGAIDTDIPIEIDFAGTSLAGQGVEAVGCRNIINLGSDKYIFNVNFRGFKQGVLKVVIKNTASPTYLDLSKPTISVSDNSGVLTVTTSIKTRVSLFRMTTGNETGLDIHGRSSTPATQHNFKVTSGNYRIGVISEAKIKNSAEYTVI